MSVGRRVTGHPSQPGAASLRMYGRRVMIRPLAAKRLSSLERGSSTQPSVAAAVGAAALAHVSRSHLGSRCVRQPLPGT